MFFIVDRSNPDRYTVATDECGDMLVFVTQKEAEKAAKGRQDALVVED